MTKEFATISYDLQESFIQGAQAPKSLHKEDEAEEEKKDNNSNGDPSPRSLSLDKNRKDQNDLIPLNSN